MSDSRAILRPIPVRANAPTAAAAAAALDDWCPGGRKTPAAGGVGDRCAMTGDGMRWKGPFLRIWRRRRKMANATIPAMPRRPKTIPNPAAAPLDKGAVAFCFADSVSVFDVGVGVNAMVAVRTTVTDPGPTLDTTVTVGSDVREDGCDGDVDFGTDVVASDEVRELLVEVEPSADVPNRLPE